ncbi:MAG: flagellar hook-basal body complex protein FliE, partial [Oscillospiraceae bacterium]|nr:flagellar hook-basal body complex protein FliE [Oscillospiraceae bacterium]
TDAEKTQAEYLLATGQLDNPAALTIASTKYEMSVELLVQIRNKALDAYSELTRINL